MSEWKPKRQFVDPQKLNRKVFDKHVDRMEVKRARDREDHRADMQALMKRLLNLENQLELLTEHVEQHCHVIGGDETTDFTPASDTRNS